MKGFILLGYEFLTVMLPAVLCILTFNRLRCRKGSKTDRRYVLFLLLFAVYLFGMFYVTGAGTIFDAKRYGLQIQTRQINLIPFSDADYSPVGYGLNVLLFVPLGFLLPLIWSAFRRIGSVLAFGFSLSLLIELSQLLNNRSTDIDDLILNTAGTMLGFALFHLYAHITNQTTRRTAGRPRACRYEAAVYVSALFLFRFLTFHAFGMAKLLYGF